MSDGSRELWDKERRVLEAARLWRRMHGDDIKFSALAGGLINAIDALDAPQPRWRVSTDGVTDGKFMIQLWANGSMDEIVAMRAQIAAALNAQEGKS